MDDLISRQDALDLLDEFEEGIEVGDRSAYTRTRKKMCELPPAQQWIPCSERLPEPGEEVFVYLWDEPYIASVNSDGQWETEHFYLDPDDAPKAWMPLPEPWKGEENGNAED